MNNIMTSLYLFFCLLSFIACDESFTSEFLPDNNSKKEITFSAVQSSATISTRATDLSFQPGDEIGIFVVKRSNIDQPGTLVASGNFAENKRYRINNNGQLEPYSENDKIFLESGDYFDYYAYYPYRANLSDPTNFIISVAGNQTIEETYTQSDFMTATIGSNNQNIKLEFKRKFALIEINFEKVAGKTLTKPTLRRTKNKALANLASNQVITQNEFSIILLKLHQETEYYYTYRAIIPVQELTGDYLFSIDVDNETVYYKATTPTPLAEGKKSVYLLNLQYRIEAYMRDTGTGTVTGSGIYKHGTTVQLRATPDENRTFEGWYESNFVGWQDTLRKVSSIPVYTFQAAKSVAYIAVTLPIYRQINIEVSSVGVNQGGYTTGQGTAIQGQNARVTAYPMNHHKFDGWYENNKLLSTDKEYVFVVPARDVNLEARFSQSCTVTLNATIGGTVKQTNSNGIYLPLEECTITAIPNKGYWFKAWYITGQTNSFTAYPEYTFKVAGDQNFTAEFVPHNYSIHVIRDFHINVTGAGSYQIGNTCTLTASSSSRYYDFGGYFDENDRLITKSKVYSFLVDSSRTIYTKNHPLTHFNYNHAYWFDHGMIDSKPTTLVENTHEFQTYTATLKTGEKARYESDIKWIESPEKGDQHRNAMQFTDKTLTIKQNGRIIATVKQPDNYIFTAPSTGNYDFIYSATCKVTIYKGEKCVGYMHLTAALWKEETIN